MNLLSLSYIKTIFSKLYEHRAKILTVAFIVLVILFVRQCQEKKYIQQKAVQNEAFYKDEISKSKTKDGRYEFEKAILVADIKTLKNDTSRLAQEVLQLKKDGSKPKIVVVTKIQYRDTGSVVNSITQLDTNKYSVDFNYTSLDKVFKLKGRNHFYATPYESGEKLGIRFREDKTFLDSINVDLDLTLGIKSENGIDKVFAKTNSDKVSILQLDAVEVEEYFKSKYSEKKKRVGIGPYIGFGATIGPGGINYGPSFGIALQYNLIRF